METKQKIREETFRKELMETEKAKAHAQDEEQQFKSYAEKCSR